MRQPGMHKIENLSTSIRGFPVLAKRTLYQRLTPKCREMAFFSKNPMMNSFGRQEGGGFRRREGKLVSPVRRDYPLHLQTTATGKREKKQGGSRSLTPPPKGSPPRKVMTRGRKEKGRQKGREEERGNRRKKEVDERKKIIKSY